MKLGLQKTAESWIQARLEPGEKLDWLAKRDLARSMLTQLKRLTLRGIGVCFVVAVIQAFLPLPLKFPNFLSYFVLGVTVSTLVEVLWTWSVDHSVFYAVTTKELLVLEFRPNLQPMRYIMSSGARGGNRAKESTYKLARYTAIELDQIESAQLSESGSGYGNIKLQLKSEVENEFGIKTKSFLLSAVPKARKKYVVLDNSLKRIVCEGSGDGIPEHAALLRSLGATESDEFAIC